jgi:CheY-like chemotaxis protein
MSKPLAFLSYTRKDDEFFGGYITAFRKMLENAVHVVSGEETFQVFQDIEGIVIGENWRKKLSAVLQESSFFMPMLTPLFFNSGPCREEVTEFRAHEEKMKRDDLILPLYFLTSAKIEKDEEKEKDSIAKLLASRQMSDWRENANVPLQEPAARQAVLKLANGIVEAIDRLKTVPKPGKDVVSLPDPRDLSADPRLDRGVDGSMRREEPSPRRILWVDDNPNNNIHERRALESYGVQFELAHDTEQAKQWMSGNENFDAVISDMGRRGDRTAGLSLLNWLRGSPKRDTPYFVYTTRSVAERFSTTRELKPGGITSDPDDLVEQVVATLR